MQIKSFGGEQSEINFTSDGTAYTCEDDIEILIEGNDLEYNNWLENFNKIFDKVSFCFNLKKVFCIVYLKNIVNLFLEKIHCPWKFSLKKENKKIGLAFKEILLNLRGLDDESLVVFEDVVANSVEGILKQKPCINVEQLAQLLYKIKK